MKWKELIHFKIDNTALTRQQKLTRLLIAFFILMIVLTMISRAADSLTVAQVTVEAPKSGAVEHSFTKEGVLSANGEVAALALPDLLVDSVPVYQGAAVKEGDILFTFSMEDLQEKVQQKQIEKQKLQLDLQTQYLSKANVNDKQEILQERAEEDYTYSAEAAEENVRRAKSDLNKANDDIARFWKTHSRDDYREYLEDVEDGWTLGESWGELEGLLETFKIRKRAYEDSKVALDKAILDAQRSIEDANLQGPESLEPQKISLDIKLIDLELSKLETVIQAEGKVLSPADGIITALNVQTGNRTQNGAAAVIAEASKGYRFNAAIDSEQAKYVARGDKIEILLSGKQKAVKATIDSITPSAEIAGGVDVLAILEEGEIGQAATLQVSKRSASYPQCVPLNAIHGAAPDQYVLVLDESETVLGKEKVARKVNVTIEDQNQSRAAVSGALSNSDKVIVGSSKSIFEGDRVRLKDE